MNSTLNLRFPECIQAEFPREMPFATAAVDRVLQVLGTSFGALSLHSPALKDNDWPNYLRCSVVRMAHAAAALKRAGVTGGRLLDYGSYFGNFALMFADLGFDVDAIDGFGAYRSALEKPIALMQSRGIRLLDYADAGRDLAGLEAGAYDVVLCAGVIEHIPHTPKGLLADLNRVLTARGHLVIDTPNLGYVYKRQALARGESVWPPIDAQFHSPIPYEGHHREFTAQEVTWMVHEVGHTQLSVELFNYSCYGQPALHGRDIENFWRTVADPEQREYITAVSQRRAKSAPASPAPHWRAVYVETESYWTAQMPPRPAIDPGQLAATEPLLVELQQEVARRDGLLSAIRAEMADVRRSAVAEATARDRTIASLNTQLAAANNAAVAEVAIRDKMLLAAEQRIAAVSLELDAHRRRAAAAGAEVAERDKRIAVLSDELAVARRINDARLSSMIKARFRRFFTR